MLNTHFLVLKFGSCEYSWNIPGKSVLHLSRGYSKAILNQFPRDILFKRSVVVRTGAEFRNHLEATSAQVKACTDNNIGYSARCFGQLYRAKPCFCYTTNTVQPYIGSFIFFHVKPVPDHNIMVPRDFIFLLHLFYEMRIKFFFFKIMRLQ